MPQFEVVRPIRVKGEPKQIGDVVTLSEEQGQEFMGSGLPKVKPYVAPAVHAAPVVEAPAADEPAEPKADKAVKPRSLRSR